MSELGDFLEQYTYDYLLQTALNRVPSDIDKRQGSIIYDAIAPAAFSLAEAFLTMRQIYRDTFAGTATGEALDKRTFERGLTRKEATKAIRKGVFKDSAGDPVNIALGTRFSTIGETTYTYAAIEEIAPGEYLLECEQLGTGGNQYAGDILPITYIQPLASAKILDIVIPAEDQETDDDLRARYLADIGSTAFAGNVAAYKKMINDINGVGSAQIYPIWNGGGTILLSVVDSTYKPVNATFLSILQDMIDPENGSGTGIGLAPIGHKVTLAAPTEYVVNVTANVVLKGGAALATAQVEAETGINLYIDELAKNWGNGDQELNYNADVYTSQITSAILKSAAIANVTDVQTNGSSDDKLLTQSSALQQIPIMGTVTLNVL